MRVKAVVMTRDDSSGDGSHRKEAGSVVSGSVRSCTLKAMDEAAFSSMVNDRKTNW